MANTIITTTYLIIDLNLNTPTFEPLSTADSITRARLTAINTASPTPIQVPVEYLILSSTNHIPVICTKSPQTNIPRSNKYKIYISALTEVNVDDHNRISTTDNRLLRRIIRDNRTRGHSVDNTLAAWQNVRNGEELYIFPYQDEADVTINSAATYELGVLKTYVEPLLYSVPTDSPYYEEAKRLIDFLRVFLPIPSDAIPEDAVIREFIGGSYFNVD